MFYLLVQKVAMCSMHNRTVNLVDAQIARGFTTRAKHSRGP